MDHELNTIDEVLQSVSDHAHRILLGEQHEALTPVYLLVGDKTALIACPWRDEREKLLTLQAVKAHASELNATMIGFVCEMWMTKYAKDANLDFTKMIPPSQHPDRIEGVLAMATDGNETKVKCWQIIRNEGGTILLLAPEETNDGMFSGRMIDGLLPKRSVH